MLYLIIDTTTGELVGKETNEKKAENRCLYLEDMSTYVFGKLHKYTYKLATN